MFTAGKASSISDKSKTLVLESQLYLQSSWVEVDIAQNVAYTLYNSCFPIKMTESCMKGGCT